MTTAPTDSTDERQLPTADSEEAPKSLAQLKELMLRGRNYREETVVEIFGGHVTLVYKPIPDEIYIPLLTRMQEKAGMDEDEAKELIEEKLDEADGEAADIDLDGVDEEFMELMKAVVHQGIAVEEMDGDLADLEDALADAVGGYYLEWAFDIMELTGNLTDAEQFRSGRNSA